MSYSVSEGRKVSYNLEIVEVELSGQLGESQGGGHPDRELMMRAHYTMKMGSSVPEINF